MFAKTMAMIVFVFAVLGILFAIAIAISPSFISSMSDFFSSESGRYMSAALNVIFGTILLLAVPVVRFPFFIKILGGYSIFAGIFTLLITSEAWSNLINFWIVENLILYRTVGVFFGVVFMAFILYATYPQKEESLENIVSEDET